MIDLSFGDPALIRSRLVNLQPMSPSNMGYRMGDSCEEEIVKWVRSYYKNYFGKEYKHIILTHGANGGLHTVVSTLKKAVDNFFINELSFSWYKKILHTENVRGVPVPDLRDIYPEHSSRYIVDSPSNPWGHQISNHRLEARTVIWDSVYASPIFTDHSILTCPAHSTMVGSFSKMLGLSGLRIGWIGTNDEFFAKDLKERALTLYCGLSTPSLEMASHVIQNLNLPAFNKEAKLHLDFSREEFDKLKNIFQIAAPTNGMFYMGVLDDKNKHLLEKAEVKGLELTTMKGERYIRFNMADDYEKTKKAVKTILQKDRI